MYTNGSFESCERASIVFREMAKNVVTLFKVVIVLHRNSMGRVQKVHSGVVGLGQDGGDDHFAAEGGGGHHGR